MFSAPLPPPQKKIGCSQLLLIFIFGMRTCSGFAYSAGLFWFYQTHWLPALQDYFGFTRYHSCLLCILSSYLAEFYTCTFFIHPVCAIISQLHPLLCNLGNYLYIKAELHCKMLRFYSVEICLYTVPVYAILVCLCLCCQ